NLETDLIAAVSNEGRLLVFPVKELPQLAKGKGNKIIAISTDRHASREEFVASVLVLPRGESLTVLAGKRHVTLKPVDIEHYMGERGRRGSMLPRGFQRAEGLRIGA